MNRYLFFVAGILVVVAVSANIGVIMDYYEFPNFITVFCITLVSWMGSFKVCDKFMNWND